MDSRHNHTYLDDGSVLVIVKREIRWIQGITTLAWMMALFLLYNEALRSTLWWMWGRRSGMSVMVALSTLLQRAKHLLCNHVPSNSTEIGCTGSHFQVHAHQHCNLVSKLKPLTSRTAGARASPYLYLEVLM